MADKSKRTTSHIEVPVALKPGDIKLRPEMLAKAGEYPFTRLEEIGRAHV